MGLATPRRGVEDFNSDFDELAALMNRSWSENKERPLRYTSEFLRSALAYPGCPPELAPAIYRGGRLVAFIAGFPRAVRISGEPKKLVSVSFLTVAPEEKRCGYGAVVWGELWNRARKFGYDGTLNFCIEGDDMNRQMPALSRLFQQPMVRIFSVHFMARFLRQEENFPSTDNANCDASGILIDAASRISENVPIVRRWSEQEAEWQCRRHGALTAALSAGGRRGIITGYSIQISGTVPMLCVMVDDVLWGNLTPGECGDLAKLFLGKAAQIGAQMVITPVLGYADMQPLVGVGFRKIRRLLHTYLTLWTPPPFDDPVSSIYMDVF